MQTGVQPPSGVRFGRPGAMTPTANYPLYAKFFFIRINLGRPHPILPFL